MHWLHGPINYNIGRQNRRALRVGSWGCVEDDGVATPVIIIKGFAVEI